MRNEMVRYSKSPTKHDRKNTLVTLANEDVVFFGVARCNRKAGDNFTKRQGQVIAKARAIRAELETTEEELAALKQGQAVVLHESNLRGACRKDKIPELLKYFDTIDSVLRVISSY